MLYYVVKKMFIDTELFQNQSILLTCRFLLGLNLAATNQYLKQNIPVHIYTLIQPFTYQIKIRFCTNTVKPKNKTKKNKKGGDDLLSHWATPAVPSAPRDFTSVFGMGTGVALWLSSPPNKMVFRIVNFTL